MLTDEERDTPHLTKDWFNYAYMLRERLADERTAHSATKTELAEARKDSVRLDWVFSNAVTWAEIKDRAAIDAAMKEEN